MFEQYSACPTTSVSQATIGEQETCSRDLVGQRPTSISVDGTPKGELMTPEKLGAQMQQMMGMQQQIMSALLAQQQEISKLTAALATVRISRTQEIAMKEAISARAAQLAREEELPGCERRIAGAIRRTLRETTGARAIGDLQSSQFDRAMDMVSAWRMSGALRRIRREAEQDG